MKDDFIPLGVQYYRAPTPLRCDWENDIKKSRRADLIPSKFGLSGDGTIQVKVYMIFRI